METTAPETTLVHLPSMIDNRLDLAAINQQLHDKTAALDWSGVNAAPETYLETLLKNLDRKKNAAELGLDGDMSDAVTADLQSFFRKQEAKSVTELPELLKPPTAFAVRRELEEIIYKDLLGPAGGEREEFNEGSVSDRYLVGQLAPQKRRGSGAEIIEEDLDSHASDEEESSAEMSVSTNKSLFPSSVGFTCSIDGAATAIKICASYGKYTRGKSENFLTKTGKPKMVWQREQIDEKFNDIKLVENTEKRFTVFSSDYGEVLRNRRRETAIWLGFSSRKSASNRLTRKKIFSAKKCVCIITKRLMRFGRQRCGKWECFTATKSSSPPDTASAFTPRRVRMTHAAPSN